jgi:hypothetical protein
MSIPRRMSGGGHFCAFRARAAIVVEETLWPGVVRNSDGDVRLILYADCYGEVPPRGKLRKSHYPAPARTISVPQTAISTLPIAHAIP